MIWVWALVAVAVLISGGVLVRAWVLSVRKRKRIVAAYERRIEPGARRELNALLERPMAVRPIPPARARSRESRDDPEPQRFGEDLEWPKPPLTPVFEPDVAPAPEPSFEGQGGSFGGAGASGGWDAPCDTGCDYGAASADTGQTNE